MPIHIRQKLRNGSDCPEFEEVPKTVTWIQANKPRKVIWAINILVIYGSHERQTHGLEVQCKKEWAMRVGALHTELGDLWIWHISTIFWYCRDIHGAGRYVYQWLSAQPPRQQASSNPSGPEVCHTHGKVHWLLFAIKFARSQNS